MTRAIERLAILAPAAVIAATVVAGAAVLTLRPRQDPASGVRAMVSRVAAESGPAPLDQASSRIVLALLAQQPDIASVKLWTADAGPRAGETPAPLSGESICAPVTMTNGPATLCAETRPAARVPRDFLIVGLAAILASLLAAIATRFLIRREMLGIARQEESTNRLLEQVQERDAALRRRTLELESANKELEAFTFSASHDLRSPLASIDGFSQALEEDYGARLDENGRECIHWIRDACRQMQELVDGLLQMSRFSRGELDREEVDLSQLARSVADGLRQRDPQRQVTFRIEDGIVVVGDPRLLRAVLENLLSNAWKFTRKHESATIELGTVRQNGRAAMYVRDDGAGFDPGHAEKMFRAFQRLHSRADFEGTGIGLATVERILHRHGGKIWAEGEVERGATFYFTTGAPPLQRGAAVN
jgi:signal transduction histidine kinase